ncbi:MAG: PASTA domain-containing protein, partial [Coriobacteriales bacterium]
RYASASEMRDDLKRVINGGTVPAPAATSGGYLDETSVMPAVERTEHVRPPQAPPLRPVPQRRTSPWVWVLVTVLVLAIGGGIVWAIAMPKTVAVPTLIGMTEAEASATVSAAGLSIGRVTSENSDQYPEGEIIRQDPAAGTRVESGTAIDIVVSAGVAQVKVPEVVGMTEADAIATIEAAELEVALPITREFSKEVPEGMVISVEPGAGATVPKGSKVVLVISKGTELAKVPNVIGKKKADAEAALKEAGFKVKVTEDYSDSVAKGVVISQNPDPDVSFDVGSTVTIVVSKGPDLVGVPDVTDMTEADAIADLEAKDLVANVVYEISPDVGIVINQDPLPGAKVPRGTTVTIVVGRAP